MATTLPRYNYIISRTLDPLFAIGIGFAAAGIRIRREENEKRAGVATTSIVSPADARLVREGEVGGGTVGYVEIAIIGWGRLWRRVTGEVKG